MTTSPLKPKEIQNPLLHPNQVTDLTLRIVDPTPDIFTVIAANCPNLQILTVYDGVDFRPSHPLEVPCRLAPDWATGLPGLALHREAHLHMDTGQSP
jgi:hypothetical protein